MTFPEKLFVQPFQKVKAVLLFGSILGLAQISLVEFRTSGGYSISNLQNQSKPRKFREKFVEVRE